MSTGDGRTVGQDEAAVQLVTGEAQLSGYRALLRNRNYRLWFLSSLGSSLGDWAGLFALQALVVSLADPGSRIALFGLGGIMMARLLPSVLFGPISGVLADRYDRKRLMVATDLCRGALFLGIAFSRDLTALFTLTFLVECLSLLYIAAKDASLPVIVPRRSLTQANQLNLLVTYGPLPFGAVTATAMIGVAAILRDAGLADIDPVLLALLVNATTFMLAGAIIARLSLPERGRDAATDDQPGLFDELRAGVRFIRELPLIRALILGVVGVFFGAGVVVTLGPEFVRTELARPPSDWFTLMAFVGSGLLAGIAATPLITSRLRPERLFPLCLAATAATATVMATLPTFGLTLSLGALLGALAGLSSVMGYTLLHHYTDDAVRARTFAAFYTGTRVAMFASLALAPFVAGALGTGTLIVAGRMATMSGVRITILVGGLVALFSAVSAARGMYRALREPGARQESGVRLSGPGARGRTQGVLIAFEGVEGSGKSTQVRALADALRREGCDVVVTREPGGAPVAERIRQMLLEPDAAALHPRAETLLMAAARVEHVQRVVLPALQAGRVVICDRFLDSSRAYQGHARGVGDADVVEINRWAIDGLLPDVVVLLALEAEEGLRRAASRAAGRADRADRMEREDVAFHRAVQEGYLRLARAEQARFVVVDASGDADSVSRRIRAALEPWLRADGEAGGDRAAAEPGTGQR